MADCNPCQGWYRLGLISKSELDSGIRSKLLDRFLSVIEFPVDCCAYMGKKFREVFVRGYESIPKYLSPGDDFLQVGFSPREEADESCLSNLRSILSQGQDNCLVSFIITPGPAFMPSDIIPGKYEKVSAKNVIWARWLFDKKEICYEG